MGWFPSRAARRSVSAVSYASRRSKPTHKLYSSSQRDFNVPEEPFYGSPRPPASPKQRSLQGRLEVALGSAVTAFLHPERADAVAALGEITGTVTLLRIRDRMQADPTGRQILLERPIVSKATIPYNALISQAPDNMRDTSGVTFGAAYGYFLKSHRFDPDERDEVRYIDDDELAYIMLRYRQCHDFWHTLTGLPPNVLGELGLKWLELFQTGLPVAALSSTVGALRLNERQRLILQNDYLPWAYETSQNASCFLMNVYYEKELDTPIDELRLRLGIRPAPLV